MPPPGSCGRMESKLTDHNGWTPPLIEDGYGRKRVATQEDIDLLQREVRLLGFLYSAVKEQVGNIDRNRAREPDGAELYAQWCAYRTALGKAAHHG
jgi:hypothetical protein